MSCSSHRLTHRSLARTRQALLALVLGLATLVVATPSLAAGSPAPGDEATAQEGISWSLTPQADRGQPRVSVRADLDPGGTTEDTLVLTNVGTEAATFDLYASDGIVTDDGQFDILTRDLEPEGAGRWIRLEQDSIELEPGESADVPITLQVPDDATPGDHPAGVVATVAQRDADGGSPWRTASASGSTCG